MNLHVASEVLQLITTAYQDVAKLSGSVGALIDNCVRDSQQIGTVWLVDDETVATCAHLVILYSEFLRGLKVQFPAVGRAYEVTSATFHPRFDQTLAVEMAQRSLNSSVPALALQDHNLVLLKISPEKTALDRDAATRFNKQISLAPMPRLKGLAGMVEDVGLALVIQTVASARKDGVLYISDERNRPLARHFLRDGKLRYAKLGKLANEQAIYQMFQHNIIGQIHFQPSAAPDWQVNAPMDRPTEACCWKPIGAWMRSGA